MRIIMRCFVLLFPLVLIFLCFSSEQKRLFSRDELKQSQNNVRKLESQVPAAGAVVVTMTTNIEEDIKELCLTLKSLSFLRGGGNGHFKSAPVLVFNEGDLSDDNKMFLKKCTRRPIAFPIIYLNNVYPDGFDGKGPDEWKRYSEWTDFRPMKGRKKWSYAQMVRFWLYSVWEHPAVQQFSTIMKIDSDACFVEQRDQNKNDGYAFAPGLPDAFVYQTNFDNISGGNPKFVEGLYDFAIKYMESEKIEPKNPKLFELIQTTWSESGNTLLPFFQTNMEIGRRSFFQKPEVLRWHETVAEKEPFGLFRKRWGDHHIRVFTMAFFAQADEIFLTPSIGYLHGRGRCAKNFIDEIYERLTRNESE